MSDRSMVPAFLLEDGAHALCAETDPEQFHPEKGESNSAAKKVCRRCDLRDPCGQWAINNPDVQGIWGALSERDRADIRRRQPIARRREPRHQTDAATCALVIDLTIRGWSLEEIARECGIDKRTVSRIRQRERERGDAA